MFFKNLIIFSFTQQFAIPADELEFALLSGNFQPCSAQQEASIGWVAPLQVNANSPLVHAANGNMLICMQKESKVLQAAAVNDLVAERVQEIEDREARRLAKKERRAIKDEVLFELLPKALTVSRKTYAYIDPKNGWLIVDAASPKAADELVSLLRKCLGSLPVVLPKTVQNPAMVMAQWLLNEFAFEWFSFGDECELYMPEQDGGKAKFKDHNLSVDEFKEHLNQGKIVKKLSMTFADRMQFVLVENLSINRLKFLDIVQEQVDGDDQAAVFDTEFCVMTSEIGEFLPKLFDAFGGLVSHEQ